MSKVAGRRLGSAFGLTLHLTRGLADCLWWRFASLAAKVRGEDPEKAMAAWHRTTLVSRLERRTRGTVRTRALPEDYDAGTLVLKRIPMQP